MNTVNSDKNEAKSRGLAVAGLMAIIIFIAWLSIQIINVVPNAFSSLASLAEGITQYEESLNEDTPTELIINRDIAPLDSGADTRISWEPGTESGAYSFSYTCVQGVSVTVANEDGVREISCDTTYNVGDVTGLNLSVTSAASRYVDVPYTVSHIDSESGKLLSAGSAKVTVVNREIDDINEDTDITEVAGVSTDDEASEETPVEETPEPTTPVVTPQPETQFEFEYQIPVSNPNGFVNLEASYIGVGGIVNNRYVAGELEKESTGAIQFAVKNIGTKTSDSWTFSIELPGGGTYESDTQLPLKPNERAVLTIGIQTDNDSSHTFVVEVETDEDIANANNSFSRRVSIQN